MAKKDLREVAQILFMQGFTQKEIALKLGVSENTISKWSRVDIWKDKKANILMSKDSRLSEMYEELAEFNKMIQTKDGYKVANQKEALARRMLIKDIKELETKYNIAETIQIGKDFTTFLKDIDFDLAMQVLNAFDGFVNHIIQKQKWQE
ncbi:MAG: terminase gpP N-terminus-related DNA-binding protein [Dysgonomonas sp.]|uniref:terminase gpP N-terminus-related DNA-binding protein n=1 Tax=Dysgonomonas sp. TaxID=1891233 RepID=UPI003A881EEE